MLAPFTALLPEVSDVEYWALERAAMALRADPARYQSVEGVSYRRSPDSLFRWEIEFDQGTVTGLVGVYPLDRLVPHEATTPAAASRPRHVVQIRPVMALVSDGLPDLEPVGETVHFHGEHHHSVTPVEAVDGGWASAVIADGHHRVAAALRHGGDEGIMTMLVAADKTPLAAGAFHRVFPTSVETPDEIPGCRVHRGSVRESILAGRITVVTPEGGFSIEPIQFDLHDPLRGLPAGQAAKYLYPVLGLAEDDARYVDDIRQALNEVETVGTAVILPASEVGAVLAAAEQGLTMPPKSTRFRPKPIRGLLMRPL